MNQPLALLLQLSHETSNWWDALIMFLVTVGFMLLLAMSGKVQLGFRVPGFATPLTRSRKRILSQHFAYYGSLSDSNKKKFERRVQAFITKKRFIPRNIDQVTEEMKVLISACAVQLTFGLPNVFLSHFKRILIYPDNYYSTINHVYHKGEVNPRLQAIVLSWKSFLEGYVNPTDGLNLGLHEMTHALHLENRIDNQEYAFFDFEILESWKRLSTIEGLNIRNQPDHFFRKYAGTNAEEFLAVAVENFFERSAEFKERLPQLYATLALLLNQNPLVN